MFGLTEEQQSLQREVRAFARKEVAPHVSEWDEASTFPAAVVKKWARWASWASSFPNRSAAQATAMSSTSSPSKSFPASTAASASSSPRIIRSAPTTSCSPAQDSQKQRWIPKLASGEWLGAWGLTEPGSGSDAGGMRTTAVRHNDGWLLNGSKTFITNGTYADCALILALTDKDKKTHGGISGFLIEKGTPGFRPGKKENKLGLRASDTAELIFEDCFVPADHLVGAEGSGFKDAMRVLDGGRISIAALSLGIARERSTPP